MVVNLEGNIGKRPNLKELGSKVWGKYCNLSERVMSKIFLQEYNPGRRRFLKVAGLTGLGLALAGCNVTVGEDGSSGSGESTNELEKGTDDYLNDFLKTHNDKSAFENATLGVTPDWYVKNRDVRDEILAIENPRERVLAAVAYFDVENNDRYIYENNGNKYACNIYARELLLFLLGDKNFAGIFNKHTGEPYYIYDENTLSNVEGLYWEFSANNIDDWMKEFGTKTITGDDGVTYFPGWITVGKDQLEQYIKTGKYIGIAVTNHDVIRSEPGFIGHASVFIPGAKKDEWGRTQATNNYRFNTDMDPIFNNDEEDFQYYVHEIRNNQSFGN